MDTKSGELLDLDMPIDGPIPPGLNHLEYGQQVLVVDVGHFEITKIDIRKQRLTLKPIPSPIVQERMISKMLEQMEDK